MSNRASRTRDRHEDRAARRAERREALLDAAVACIQREGPGASMDDIAAEAGLTKPILYRYFRHKADLYEAIAGRYMERLDVGIRRAMRRKHHPRALLASSIDVYIRLVERERELYRFLVRRSGIGDGPVEDFMRRLGDEIGLVLGERLRELGLDSGPAEVWGHGIVGMVSAAVDWWVDRPVLPRRRLVEYLVDLLWLGFNGAGRVRGAAPGAVEDRDPTVVVPMRTGR